MKSGRSVDHFRFGTLELASRAAGGDQGSARNNSLSFWKLGVPSPVTGSQPGTAENPGVPQPCDDDGASVSLAPTVDRVGCY